MQKQYDIVIAGSGPAGLVLAASCVRAGLSVLVASPDLHRPWPNSYGLWLDEVPDVAVQGCAQFSWDDVGVWFSDTDTKCVQRAYARVDNAALRRLMLARAHGADLSETRVTAVVPHRRGATVVTADGSVEARFFVDATGAGALLDRAPATAFQAAWGEVIRTADLDPARPRWMDFTPIPGDETTFLYALPLGGDRWLVEETSLVHAPGLSFEVLRARLHARLTQYGVRTQGVEHIERVMIPMNTPIPPMQRVIGFGAAAAMGHASTGYLLARILHDAPRLAATLAAHRDADPDVASRAAWATLWPAHRVRQRGLHLYGAEVVSRLNADETREFFRNFFALPPATVRAWLSDRLPPDGLVAAMAMLFPQLSPRLQWKAASGGKFRHLVTAALAWHP
jgi:lycopene beta-cyclase